MEPKSPTPNFELPPTPITPPETLPNGDPTRGVESAPEQRPERGKEVQSTTPVAPTLPSPVVAAPSPPVPVSDSGVQTTTGDDDFPLVANDEDLIEREWVDKAKKIIQQTKDDPHKRENEVGKLQADYLRKRYGKELGASE